MDVRDFLTDGISQLNEWLENALKEVSPEQMNWLPEGQSVSIGFNAWHILRTEDNITNFVMQRKNPVWMEDGFVDRMGLPKVAQGTGMGLEEARAMTIADPAALLEYSGAVAKSCLAFLKDVPLETLEEIQLIKPLGEMPRWKVFRQVVMTHGFMHLGEINAHKGQLGLSFGI
ncbi:MAG: DinB family protein [Tepidiformaceae bacterium]